MSRFTNLHNRLLVWGRNTLLKSIVDRGIFMQIAEKEILQNAAIDVTPL